MKKVIVFCSGAGHIKKGGTKLGLERFPDGEINIHFKENLKSKKVVLVQSFYGDINEKIVEVLFAGHTAKEIGAKKVELFALYFPYFRKDKRDKKRECISINAMSKIFSTFDEISVVEPHLHRIKNIKDVFKNGRRIKTGKLIAKHLKKIENPLFIGPDSESKQWAKEIAEHSQKEYNIFRKKRYNSKKVRIKINKNINLKNRNIVIVDDIISTGHTMIETIKEIKKFKPKKIYCVAIHGIFADNALKKLKRHARVLSTNTIPSEVSKINISELIK